MFSFSTDSQAVLSPAGFGHCDLLQSLLYGEYMWGFVPASQWDPTDDLQCKTIFQEGNNLPKYYANVCEDKDVEYSDYKNFKVEFGTTQWKHNGHVLDSKIGSGKYSDVFVGINTLNNELIAIKILKPVKEYKIKREVKVLQTLKGGVNIINLIDVTKHPITNDPTLIMEYIDTGDLNKYELYKTFTDHDIRFYMYEVLKALDYSHSMGIMHRDIKPGNIMIDHSKKKLTLIDWGLAEFYHPQQEYNVKVASRFWKGPELLIGLQTYDYSLDIWSLGCVFAGMIFKIEKFFNGKDNHDQLDAIEEVLGSDDLFAYLEKYNKTMDSYYDIYELDDFYEQKSWDEFTNSENQMLVNDDALDLLDKMLRYDHSERITPKDAMEHPYFKHIREDQDINY